MLTRNDRQEGLSRAYVRAIAAYAGVAVAEPEPDYGIDLSLRAVTVDGGRRRDAGAQIDLQLKSTARVAVGTTDLAYDLEATADDDLRANSRVPRFLVVFVLPADEDEWLTQSDRELIVRHAAYWLSLRGMPETAATRSVRVSVPLTNLFSVPAAQSLLQLAAGGGSPP